MSLRRPIGTVSYGGTPRALTVYGGGGFSWDEDTYLDALMDLFRDEIWLFWVHQHPPTQKNMFWLLLLFVMFFMSHVKSVYFTEQTVWRQVQQLHYRGQEKPACMLMLQDETGSISTCDQQDTAIPTLYHNLHHLFLDTFILTCCWTFTKTAVLRLGSHPPGRPLSSLKVGHSCWQDVYIYCT